MQLQVRRLPTDGLVALALALLLVADASFEFSGLPALAPLSTLLGFLDVAVVACCLGIYGVGCLAQDHFKTANSRVPAALGVALFLCVAPLLASWLIGTFSPLGERLAYKTLASSFPNAERFAFDPSITEADRARVLASSNQDWKLYVAGPGKRSYDFRLASPEPRQIGARVRPPSLWESEQPIWIFYDLSSR